MNNTPTIFVILGVTGDLAKNKLLPALFDLFKQNLLPQDFKIVGFSRRDWKDDDFKRFTEEVLGKADKSGLDSFLNHISYISGEFNKQEDFKKLENSFSEIDKGFGRCSNKLFYLAIPPTLYKQVLINLADSKLTIPCGGKLGWTRILIEKPFGNDTKTAQELDKMLGKLFKEEQIYRIDHYLAKEALQNVLAFRFSNSLFESLWNRKYIEKVEINMFEEASVGGRHDFYEANGALKDVGQNHVLQMLALIAMEKPKSISCADIRKNRGEVLSKLKRFSGDHVRKAQYEGYSQSGDSKIETFFSLKACVNTRRFKGVPFYLSSGKALSESCVEIRVHFKDLDQECFIESGCESQEKNILTFRIQPDEKISILFWVKVPGFENKIGKKELSFSFHEDNSKHIDAYEKVLFDCISGDQTLFASTREVQSAWKFVESVLDSWENIPLEKYEKGSSGKDLIIK